MRSNVNALELFYTRCNPPPTRTTPATSKYRPHLLSQARKTEVLCAWKHAACELLFQVKLNTTLSKMLKWSSIENQVVKPHFRLAVASPKTTLFVPLIIAPSPLFCPAYCILNAFSLNVFHDALLAFSSPAQPLPRTRKMGGCGVELESG